ncbi:MAG: cellulose biosynthesis protein BcsN, partial [Pseudomonadota bacterium]
MTPRSAVFRRRPITTLALAGLLALALSACATAPSAITWGEAAGPQTFDLKQASLVTTVAPSYALARFGPPGPRATAVQQSLEAENVTQTVLLVSEAATPGQNALDIVLREGGRLERPSLRAITAEIAKAFPEHRLAIADRATSNRYGPYGLAYGRSSGVGCGYAWQQVDGQERATGILPGRRYRLDIRLRFCGA